MFRNWKTTLAALAGGLAIAVQGNYSRESLMTAIGLVLTGLVAKDHNVTGGTTRQ